MHDNKAMKNQLIIHQFSCNYIDLTKLYTKYISFYMKIYINIFIGKSHKKVNI